MEDNVNETTDLAELNLTDKQKENLIALLDNTENIIGLLNKKHKKNLIIDLPKADNHTTSIGVNKKVWDSFKKFSDKHKQFTSKDLISLALKELMENYK